MSSGVNYRVDGKAVRRAGLRARKTQKDVKRETGISYTTISRIENGLRVRPHFSTIEHLFCTSNSWAYTPRAFGSARRVSVRHRL